MYVLLEFWQKIMAIPIMNPLSWFMISFVTFFRLLIVGFELCLFIQDMLLKYPWTDTVVFSRIIWCTCM